MVKRWTGWIRIKTKIYFTGFQSCFHQVCVWNEFPLRWRHNGRDCVSNHQPHGCLLNRSFRRKIKENIKAPSHWPLCGEFTGPRWIPRTNGQERGKCLHLMTSSCIQNTNCTLLWPAMIISNLLFRMILTCETNQFPFAIRCSIN